MIYMAKDYGTLEWFYHVKTQLKPDWNVELSKV